MDDFHSDFLIKVSCCCNHDMDGNLDQNLSGHFPAGNEGRTGSRYERSGFWDES